MFGLTSATTEALSWRTEPLNSGPVPGSKVRHLLRYATSSYLSFPIYTPTAPYEVTKRQKQISREMAPC